MKAAFHFSTDLRLILYGVNAYSERMSRTLQNEGYTVAAYFDRRYEALDGNCSFPVYGLVNHPFINLAKDGFCVIIMLQNAMQHEVVAMEFLRQGFHKILFAPMDTSLEEKTALALRFQYNLFLEGQFHMLHDIPLLSEAVIQPEIGSAHSIIKEEGSFKIVWCPTELLYTNPPRLCRDPAILRYANVPLYSYYPYTSMFEYLRGTGGESCQYLNEYGVNSCKYQNSLTNMDVILQRKQLLEIYRNALNKGMDLFISSAPSAEWNETHRVFNLLEGQHRSLFLAMEGFRYIPIRISQSDFDKWNIVCSDKEVLNYADGDGKRPHVLHPKYHRINEHSDRDDLMELESIQKYLSGTQDGWRGMLEGKAVLDLSGTCGYYARNALRMQAEKAVLYAPEGKTVARELHALEGFLDIRTVDGWNEVAGEPYHVLFVLNALKNMPPEEKKIWIGRCSELCGETCFVSVKDTIEMEAWKIHFAEAESLITLTVRGEINTIFALRKR